MRFGIGRVVILGEAGLLSAQLAGETRTPMGMNARVATQNGQFTLNLLRWLARFYDDAPAQPSARNAP